MIVDDRDARIAQLEAELRLTRAENATLREQHTATADVLRVIASSPTDLQPVLEAIVASAKRLTRSTNGQLVLREGDVLRQRVSATGSVFQAGDTLSMAAHDRAS